MGWRARLSLSLVLLTVLHLLAGRALAEHLAEVPIQLPEGLARGRHFARASALPTLSPPPSAQAPQRRLPRACFFPARLDAVTGPAVTCERRRLDVRGGRRCLHARVDASRRAEWRRPGRGVVTRRVLSPDRRRGQPIFFGFLPIANSTTARSPFAARMWSFGQLIWKNKTFRLVSRLALDLSRRTSVPSNPQVDRFFANQISLDERRTTEQLG